jgi:selenocysteine lyase/cysteine desulfurase
MPTTPLPRDAFDLDPASTWALHCAEGPVPRGCADEIAALLPRETRPWAMRWPEDFLGIPARVRAAGAALLGVPAGDLSLVPTTSSGLIAVAQGFPWEPGDEVVAPLGEFPSNAWPWITLRGRGVAFREVSLWDGQRAGREAWDSTPPDVPARPEERLLDAVGPRTRIVTVSWVRFQDGLALDLVALARGCRERGVALVVDGIQGAGTRVARLDGVAAFATGGHKGLLAPQGLGLLYTEPEFRARLAPPGGWLAVEDATDFDRPSTDFARGWAADGTRLEHGVPNLLSCVGLAASIEFVVAAGVARIAAHVAALQRALLARLGGSTWAADAARLARLLDADRVASILAFHHGGRGPAGLVAALKAVSAARVYASVREGYLRVALHGWHDEGDVERLAAWLRNSPAR